MLGPRIVIAGVSSGVGKTTIATGLMAALVRHGVSVAAAKVGPDFIDPGYHALACRRPARNLDPWLCGCEAIAPLASRAASGTDILVVEGVMGLFDGAVDGEPSSTADVGRLLDAPVVLVIDASAMSTSVAALVRGYRDHDPGVRVAGVVLNRVASDTHEEVLREAIEPLGLPVVGCLRRDDALVWRDRHLGLVPVAEHPAAVTKSLERLALLVSSGFDLDLLQAIARSAPRQSAARVCLPAFVGRSRIAVASGPAFTFGYTDNVEALEATGAEVVPFDPLHDAALPPAVGGLMIGGGFPEVYGEQLAANGSLMRDVAVRVAGGLPTWAECGGLLWLCTELDGRPMVGAVPTRATLGNRLVLGYRHGRTMADSPIGLAGTVLRGHEFHYSVCEPTGEAIELSSRFGRRLDGFATPTFLATYLHHHAGGDPALVAAFARSCCGASYVPATRVRGATDA
jgi:cobyrinic acid a,c-diamide synthase